MANVLEILFKLKGGDEVKKQSAEINKNVSETKEIFSKLGTLLTVGIVAKGFSNLIKSYAAQEEATIKLNSALRTQGIVSEEISKSFLNQAAALQKITLFGDEATIAGQAFALSMGISADTVQKITPIVLDFASAMGVDLQTAFRIMGQAAAGETGLLKRYGIIIDEDELKTKGFNAVIETMQKNFEGTAEAVAKSGVGPMKQFANTIGDVKERLGKDLAPSLNDTVQTFKEWLPFLEKIGLGILAVVNTALQGFGVVAKTLNALFTFSIAEQKKIPGILAEQGKKIEKIWSELPEKMLAIEKSANEEREKETEKTEKKKQKIRAENSEAWEKRLKEEAEKQRKIEEEAIGKRSKKIEEEYELRRQLREMDLGDVIASIEKQIEVETEGSEERKALELALSDYRKALNIETAADIAKIQEAIQSNLESNLTDMLMSEKTFGDTVQNIWKNLERVIIETIVKEVIEAKASALLRIGAEQAVAAAKAISAYSGIPFVGIALGIAAVAAIKSEIDKNKSFQAGTQRVPGPEGAPVQATVHGGEKILTLEQQKREGNGKSIQLIVNINGTFIEADDTKWDRLIREKMWNPLQRLLSKTGEQFSGR